MAQSHFIDVLPQATQIYESAFNSFTSDGDNSHALSLCTEMIQTLETTSNISWNPSLKSIVLKVRVLLVRIFMGQMEAEEALAQAKLVFCAEMNGSFPLSSEVCDIFDNFVMDRMMDRDFANDSTLQIVDEMQQLLDFTLGPQHPLSLRNQATRNNCERFLDYLQDMRNESPDVGYESFEED